MVTIQATKDRTTLFLKAHYNYKDRIKKCGAFWNGEMWVATFDKLPRIEREFKGELYYKTPKWFIDGAEPKVEERTLYSEGVTVPELSVPLYDYQDDGIRFMVDRIRHDGFVLNSDDMGSGKTAMSIATMKWFYENENARKFLIVCKKSLKLQWREEIKKFGWDMPVFVTGETPKKRKDAYNGLKESDRGVLITNYHNYLNDVEEIRSLRLDFCTVDEVHSVKAHKGKMNNGIAEVCQNHNVILLTGTPIMSSPADIYGIFNIATDDYFGSYRSFENRYLETEFGIYGKQIIGAKNLDELYGKIHDVMIRRTTAEISVQLPEVTLQVVPVEMDKTQEKMDGLITARKEANNLEKEELLKNEPLTEEIMAEIEAINEKEKQFLAAQQFIADDPRLFLENKSRIADDLKGVVPKGYKVSNKVEATVDLVEDILQAGEKVIVFTHFLTPALLLKAEMEKRLKVSPLMYTGRESEERRNANVEMFMNSDECNVLIANDAAAEGLNLQKAKFLINFEQADTYAQKWQRIGRIRRVGSEHSNVTVYDMVTEGSFDEIKLRKIEKDKDLVETLIGD